MNAGEVVAAFQLSILVALCCSLLLMPCAAVLGYALQRQKLGIGWRWLFSLPLSLPPVASGVLLLWLFSPLWGPGAWLQRWGLNPVLSWGGAVIASCLVALPLVVQAGEDAWARFPEQASWEARGLGASRWQVWTWVALPQVAPGLLRAGLLAFQRSLGEFGATLIVAGNIPRQTQTLPLALFSATESGQYQQSAWVLACSLLLAGLCVVLVHLLERRLRRYSPER